ncbi:zinc-dependent alcohol dehydrogenase [Glycomyces halotolerans]
MKAVIWKGRKSVGVADVPDPELREPTDAIVRVTSTAICGSDLHLYNVLAEYMEPGDILGHEAMGVVEETGSEVTHVKPGDRVVIPFNIACGSCWMCERGLTSQCETTQMREAGKGGKLFGYTSLYGSVPGAQAELLRVPQAHFGPIGVPDEYTDERFLFLSDILPTAWQAARYADVEKGGTVAVVGLGPVGQFCCRVAAYFGASKIIGVDTVPERLALAARYGVEAVDTDRPEEVAERIRDLTDGRGADSVIDAVGMEAHGSPVREWLQQRVDLLPDPVGSQVAESVGTDRLEGMMTAFDAVRRGGTVSIVGVYGGQADPMPMMDLFDKGLTIRMGQCNVKRWIDEIWPALLNDSDPLGTEDLASHRMPLAEAERAYRIFNDKDDGCVKVVLKP